MTVLRLYTNLRHALAAILEICVVGLQVILGDLLGVPAVVPGPRQCVLHGSVGPGIEYECE